MDYSSKATHYETVDFKFTPEKKLHPVLKIAIDTKQNICYTVVVNLIKTLSRLDRKLFQGIWTFGRKYPLGGLLLFYAQKKIDFDMSNKENCMKENLQGIKWEVLEIEGVLQKLDTSLDGLADKGAVERLMLFGENKLPEAKKDGLIKRFLKQFHNSLIYVLLGASILTAIYGHWIDTWVILAVVFINAIIGYIQEGKAQKALDSIKNLLSLKADVIRGGQRKEVYAETLVPGDIVLLKAGDKVPADVRLIKVSHFEIDESSLTGESIAVQKTTNIVKPGTVLGERECMAYAGTTIRTGTATGIVISTAADTEVGKINTLLTETQAEETPLVRKMNKLGTRLSLAILGFSALLALYSIFVMDLSFAEAFTAVVGLAVAAIPEGLPAVVTITLAIGVRRMAHRNALVRSLPSVETLGSVTVICSDKTGTLTKNEMTATNIYIPAGDFVVSGLGYSPEGTIMQDGCEVDFKTAAIKRLVQSIFLCNEADVIQKNNVWIPQGAPTEAALKTLALKAKFVPENTKLISDIPFDSQHKYRATLHQIGDKKVIFVVGAPDRILDISKSQIVSDKKVLLERSFWEEKIAMAAGRGQRLIGCAYMETDADKITIEHEDLKENLVFAGIVGIIDPPCPEAIEAIRVCKQAGVRVKMITGDHVLTAREIAMQMGLTTNPQVISGAELEEMSDEQMRKVVANCDIFARTSPEHKFRLVKALQEVGEIVAMTGDGVNDAPALKKADIGVAMGIKGTEVTKEAAEMVLADDNFKSIVSAVEEGRTIYGNIRKTILFIFATNGAEALVMTIPLILGLIMPVTPVQILWANLVTAVTSALSLVFEPAEKDVMNKAPRSPKEPLLGKSLILHMVFVAAIISAFTIGIFQLYEPSHGFYYARTMAVNMLIIGEMFYLFNCRNMHHTILGKDFWRNKMAFILAGILFAIQLAYTYLPPMQQAFGSVALRAIDWLYLLAGGTVIFLAMEFQKVIVRKFRKV